MTAFALWLVLATGVVLATAYSLGYVIGRWQQQAFDWRVTMRRQERIMADFTALQTEILKLIARVQTPAVENPAIQAEIDRLAAEVRAVNEATPAGPSG